MKEKIYYCYCILTFLIISVKTEDLVEYYLNLEQDFQQNASEWEPPTDSRKFFQIADEELEPVYYGHYDFIIVGAGVAGSVLSNRLTECRAFKVLLIEAGGPENDFTDVPGFATQLPRSDFNWGYKTIPQKTSCLGMKNKQCTYPRGKAVGGSSVINYLIYARGNKEDFDKWGSKNPGWNYENVLPYFEKSENSTLELEEPEFHGHDGPVSVQNVKYRPDVLKLFLEAAKQRGWDILDYNGKNQTGFSPLQMMTKKGKRCSAGKAYIKPAMNRQNLEILDHSLGIKILIENKKAYGVEFIRNNKKYIATSSKEVIISSGVMNSPQLLMLSGIGPKEHLEEVGIPVIQDLAVAQNLDDHPIFPALFFGTNLSVGNPPLKKHIQDYLEGFGLLTTAISLSGIGFASPTIKSNNPSVEYVFFSAFIEQAAEFILDVEVTQENWDAMSKPVAGKYVWGIIPLLLHQKSRGTVRLKSKDPLDFPMIDSNFYSDGGDDMNEMLAIIKDIFDISKTPAFQSINSQYLSGPLPACSSFVHLSNDYWRCALNQLTYPISHGVSTCKMGPRYDKTSIVDNKLRVYGIDSLRVADASIIPFSIAGHPTATVYMIGEKLSDFLREEYGDCDCRCLL